MSSQSENVQINLKLNGIEEFKKFKDLTAEVAAQTRALSRMDRTDPGYQASVDRLNRLVILQREWRNEIYATSNAARDANKEMGSAWDKIKDLAGGVSIGNLISGGLESAWSALSEFNAGADAAYAEAEQNQAQLEAVIKSTGSAAGRSKDQLNELSGSLMDLTGVDDDLITKSESLLLTFTKISGEMFDRSLPLILDMSRAMGTDLNAATIQVGKALNNPIKGLAALSKVGVSFNESQKETIKTMQKTGDIAGAQAIILKELEKEFGGVAAAAANTASGSLQKFETRLGNIQESLGAFRTEIKAGLATAFAPFLTWLERATSNRLSETLEQDRAALAGNIVQLQASNTSHEQRIKIINDLKAQYPQYIGQIDAEKASNEKLLPLLEKINQAMVIKIAFQKKSEGLNDAMQDEADAFLRADKAATSLSMTMGAITSKLKDQGVQLIIPKNLTDLQQVDFLMGKLRESAKDGKTFGSELAIKDLAIAKENILGIRRGYEEAKKAKADLLNDQTKFASKYGLNTSGDDNQTAEYKAQQEAAAKARAAKEAKDEADANADAAKRKAAEAKAKAEREKAIAAAISEDKKLNEEYQKLGIERLNNLFSENEKEVELVKQKFQKLIDEQTAFLAAEGTTAEQRKSRDEQIADLKLQKDKAVADTRIKIETEMSTAVGNLRTTLSEKHVSELEKEKDQINKFYDDQVKKNTGNADALASISVNRAKDLTDAELREKQRLVDEKDKIDVLADSTTDNSHANRLAKIKEQYDKEIAALAEKFSTEGQMTQEYQDLVNKINANRDTANHEENKKKSEVTKDLAIQGAETVANAVFQIGANNRKRETDQKMKGLEDARAKELSNKNLTEDQKNAINAKYDAKVKAEKLRAWKAEQNAAAKQALIAGLLGAAKALPNFVLAGIALGTGILNAALIKSEKPPIFRKGAMVPTGPSHEQGGIDIVNNSTGERLGEMEGGEPIMVLSKNTYGNNRELINELLYNSQYRNGAPVSVNTELASKAMRYASGGVLEQMNQYAAVPAPVQLPGNSNSGVEDKLETLINKWDDGIPFNYLNLVEHKDKVDKIRNRVNA